TFPTRRSSDLIACPDNTIRVRRCQTFRHRQIDRKQRTCLPVSKPSCARPRELKRNECKTRSGYESLLLWPLRGLRNFLVSRNEALELLHVVIRHSRNRKALLKHF